jgi:hypothetical protein
MIDWTGEADTPKPTAIFEQDNRDAQQQGISNKQPRYVDKDELYGFHNFAVLDSLINGDQQ